MDCILAFRIDPLAAWIAPCHEFSADLPLENGGELKFLVGFKGNQGEWLMGNG